jgi:hypothetical protein
MCFLPIQKCVTVTCEAIERHNSYLTKGVTKESSGYLASRWILSCLSKPSCLYITRTSLYTFMGGGGGLESWEIPATGGGLLTFKDSRRPIFAIQSQGPYQRSQIQQKHNTCNSDSCSHSEPPATELFGSIPTLSRQFLGYKASV